MSATFRIPTEITIRRRAWQVVRGGTAPLNAGEINRDACVIRIAKGLSAGEARSTFLHELMHACVYRPSPPVSDSDEEKFIAGIEGPLLRALEQLEWRSR